LPSSEETARGLRDRPLGKALILVVVLVAALLVSRSCGATNTDVSQDEAIAIAKEHVDFTPNNAMVRLLKRGLQSKPFWAVSLSIKQPDATLENVTVVVVDANTGEVAEIRKSSP